MCRFDVEFVFFLIAFFSNENWCKKSIKYEKKIDYYVYVNYVEIYLHNRMKTPFEPFNTVISIFLNITISAIFNYFLMKLI